MKFTKRKENKYLKLRKYSKEKEKNKVNHRIIIIFQILHWKINRLIKYVITVNVNSKK